MIHGVSLLPLVGIAVIVAGFLLRLNPMLVVLAGALATGFAAHLDAGTLLGAIGTGFVSTRNISLVLVLPLAVVALLERHGLRERAQAWIASIPGATLDRVLIAYLGFREITAAIGLSSIAGQAQMVRPLLAPMSEGAAASEGIALDEARRQAVRARCAAVDNVGLFFGEDIFVAFGAVALMHEILKSLGYDIAPMRIALWALPTAICAFAIHALRIMLFARRLRGNEHR